MMDELIATLFLVREYAHREHLAAKTFAQHEALGELYTAIVDDADAIAEAYQGRTGKRLDIPYLPFDGKGELISVLERLMSNIENMRYKACDKADTPIQNLIDGAIETMLSTLNKLKHYK